MEMKDLEFRKLYQKILIGLLSENFSVDYFSKNKEIRKIIVDFLQLTSSNKLRIKKDKLLAALKEKKLDSVSDQEVLNNAEYKNSKIIEYIFSEHNSLFSVLSLVEKQALITVDICYNSILEKIFYSEKKVFYLKDFYLLISFVLDTLPEHLILTISCAKKTGLVDFDKTNQRLATTNTFEYELYRLSTIPHFETFDLDDYIVSGDIGFMTLSFPPIISLTGECVSSYVYSRLEQEGTYYWYIKDEDDFVKLSDYLGKNRFYAECIWLDKYLFDTENKKMSIFRNTSHITDSLVICGNQLKIFSEIPCLKISLKDNCLKNKVDRMFPSALADSINDYISKITATSKKRDFISEVKQLVVNTDSESALNCLPDLFTDFKSRMEKEEAEKQSIIIAIDENDFIKRYGLNACLCNENQGIKEKILNIYQTLKSPADYLKADNKMFVRFNTLMQQHPNIIDTQLLYAVMKITVLLSKDNIIRMSPLLFVGNPGCGKTLLCKELRELFNQNRDIFIPMGNGAGITGLFGSTQEYKGASYGQILSSVWNSVNNNNCLNPLIVIDEIEKACLSAQTNDINQNVLPSLLQLFGDENISHFKDNYFDIEIKHFYPNFIATANSMETIPQALLDRTNIIRFRDYTKEELKRIIIPYQFELFKKNHNALIPETLNEDEIEIIFNLCKGKTRQIQPAIFKYIAAIFDTEGQKHKLNNMEVEDLLKDPLSSFESKQIGFFRNFD